MDEHKTDEQIQAEVAEAKRKVEVGATYHHYKSTAMRYEVVGFATLESTNELCVIYKALYGSGFQMVRPVAVWLETVEWKGKTVPRFTKV